MSEVEFNYLSSKVVGNDTVVFRLEDGTQVIVRVEIVRAGYRVDKGGKQYHLEFNNLPKVIPSDKKFKVVLPQQPNISEKGREPYTK